MWESSFNTAQRLSRSPVCFQIPRESLLQDSWVPEELWFLFSSRRLLMANCGSSWTAEVAQESWEFLAGLLMTEAGIQCSWSWIAISQACPWTTATWSAAKPRSISRLSAQIAPSTLAPRSKWIMSAAWPTREWRRSWAAFKAAWIQLS